jgi:hypothetical protein
MNARRAGTAHAATALIQINRCGGRYGIDVAKQHRLTNSVHRGDAKFEIGSGGRLGRNYSHGGRMKSWSVILGTVAVLAAGGASAQPVNLTGIYRCVDMCRGNMPPHVTQNGPEINLVTEAGVPSRAWPDWYSPTSRIWVEALNQSAVYSPDGILIQFDNGTIWHRDVLPPAIRRR